MCKYLRLVTKLGLTREVGTGAVLASHTLLISTLFNTRSATNSGCFFIGDDILLCLDMTGDMYNLILGAGRVVCGWDFLGRGKKLHVWTDLGGP